MTTEPFPDAAVYRFELAVQITSNLSLSVGEIALRINNGLFTLDERGLLFPGVTERTAVKRLQKLSIRATGHETSRLTPTEAAAYGVLVEPREPRSRRERNLLEGLDAGMGIVASTAIKLQSLEAKIGAAADHCRNLGTLGTLDEVAQRGAARLIGVAIAVDKAVEAALEPVL